MSASKVATPTGSAYRSSTCRDDWPNMRWGFILGQPLHMQLCAIRAYRQACRDFAKLSGWSPERVRRTGGRAILLTGSWRSCALQRELHARDPRRFASADGSLHPQGLAIDVNTVQPDAGKAYAALRRTGWVRARPTDEPWHHSWGFKA